MPPTLIVGVALNVAVEGEDLEAEETREDVVDHVEEEVVVIMVEEEEQVDQVTSMETLKDHKTRITECKRTTVRTKSDKISVPSAGRKGTTRAIVTCTKGCRLSTLMGISQEENPSRALV